MICGVYKITNLINNKVYIGQSVDIESRWEAEKEGYINKHATRAFKKYGINNFSFEILTECTKEELDKWEIYYIKYYDSCNPQHGYNKLSGGYNGSPNEETRKKLVKQLKKGIGKVCFMKY